MKETTKTFVTVWYPGSFFAEEDTHEVKERDPMAIAGKYPRCFAFKFFDQVCGETEIGGEKQKVRSKPRNESPKYFPGGKLMNAEEVEKTVPNSRILVTNMRGNGWDQIVKTRVGNFQPFEKDCEVL